MEGKGVRECKVAPSGATFIQWLAQLPYAEGSLFSLFKFMVPILRNVSPVEIL